MTDAARRHPGAWWAWALGLAVAAASTTNALVLLLLAGAACCVVLLCRGEEPWARAFRMYLAVAAFVLLTRIVMRLLFDRSATVADALADGATDGLQLGAMIVFVGAANALADPKQLLASLPAALQEIGTAVVIACSVFPQLAESAARVNRVRRLRPPLPGGRWRRLTVFREVLVPVLEDALERSMQLAASMDARGFGRSDEGSPRTRRRTGALLVTGLLCICVGMYGMLDATAPRLFAVPTLLVGLALAMAGGRAAGRRVERTRYRPARIGRGDLLVAASGIATAASIVVAARLDPEAIHPELSGTWLPPLPTLALVAVLVAGLPAALSSSPLRATREPTT